MAKIDPLPDMTEEEAYVYDISISRSDDQFRNNGEINAKILANYIERHRADLTASPLERLAAKFAIPVHILKNSPKVVFKGLSTVENGFAVDYDEGNIRTHIEITHDELIHLLKAYSTDPSPAEAEKKYSTSALIENLKNALDNGYTELGETDLGDLLQLIEDEKGWNAAGSEKE